MKHKILKTKNGRGFTLVEIIIIVAIIVILSALTFQSFSNLSEREALDKEALHVLSLLHEARSLTLSSKNATQYGVHLENSRAILFPGSSYSAGNPANKIVDLKESVTISTITLTGGGSDVIFNRLTGATGESGTTTLSLLADPSQTKTSLSFPPVLPR